MNWQTSASLSQLQKRADILRAIREFFFKHDIMEVETPLLCHATIPDPHIHSFTTRYEPAGSSHKMPYYLQTSPEFAMKRLLASGSGSIYQLCKAFRNQERGKQHNPEFTILEWYRIGYDHHALMNEMDLFLQDILQTKAATKISYHDLFMEYLEIEPHNATINTLKQCAKKHTIFLQEDLETKDDWLQLLMTHSIEPFLGHEQPCFVYDYPKNQAALARIIRNDIDDVAARFEVYFKGFELANGFYELQDPNEQIKRFQSDLAVRERKGLPQVPIDENFISALQTGLPECAGVALGVDRLVMLATKVDSIDDVISFSIERA